MPKIWQGKGRRLRQQEAQQRQAERDKRTPAQQVARLDRFQHRAKRERARLSK